MKYFNYLLLVIFLGGCAVQGPILGGPEDKDPPKFKSIYPADYSIIEADTEIVMIFDELVDPNSVQKSIKIENNKFRITTRGKKVIIYPEDEWNSNNILNIYISRDLKDYRNNYIDEPIDLSFSFGQKIPPNSIKGKIIDVNNIINNYVLGADLTVFEVGLYEILETEKKMIKTVETNKNLEFSFSAVENGTYSIIAVETKILDPKLDFEKRKYSVLSDNLTVNNESNEYIVSLNSGNPISKGNISSINFINQYYVGYLFTDGQEKLGVIDTIYNNFKKEDFTRKELSISIEMENEFENYRTESFSFIVPELSDSISPRIQECSISNSIIDIWFSEPLDLFDSDNLFYFYDNLDSNKIDFDILNIDPKRGTMTISSNQVSLENLSIEINEGIIKDLSGNITSDTAILSNNCTKVESKITDYGLGGILGEVDTENLNPLIVVAYNGKTQETTRTFIGSNNKFSLKMLEPGEYFLQIYENYKFNSENLYPFYPGGWEPFRTSARFSDVVGPIEVRANWDIEDVIIEF